MPDRKGGWFSRAFSGSPRTLLEQAVKTISEEEAIHNLRQIEQERNLQLRQAHEENIYQKHIVVAAREIFNKRVPSDFQKLFDEFAQKAKRHTGVTFQKQMAISWDGHDSKESIVSAFLQSNLYPNQFGFRMKYIAPDITRERNATQLIFSYSGRQDRESIDWTLGNKLGGSAKKGDSSSVAQVMARLLSDPGGIVLSLREEPVGGFSENAGGDMVW